MPNIDFAHITWQMLYWPGGIVLGNLLANIIWEWPSQLLHYWRSHHQNKKQTEHIKNHIDSKVTDVKTG